MKTILIKHVKSSSPGSTKILGYHFSITFRGKPEWIHIDSSGVVETCGIHHFYGKLNGKMMIYHWYIKVSYNIINIHNISIIYRNIPWLWYVHIYIYIILWWLYDDQSLACGPLVGYLLFLGKPWTPPNLRTRNDVQLPSDAPHQHTSVMHSRKNSPTKMNHEKMIIQMTCFTVLSWYTWSYI